MEKYTVVWSWGFFIHSCGGVPIGEVSEIWSPSASDTYGRYVFVSVVLLLLNFIVYFMGGLYFYFTGELYYSALRFII